MITIKPLPQSVETESILLGACLQFPEALYIAVNELSIDDFFKESHRVIFEAIVKTHSRGKEVDTYTVAQDLQSSGMAEKAGGITYLASLMDIALGWRATREHCAIIRGKAVARAAIKFADQLKASCHDDADAKWAIENFSLSISQLFNRESSRLHKVSEITNTVFDNLKKVENGEINYGIKTGFSDIDRRIVGMAPGNLFILAARPSMGKTALAVNIGTNVAKQDVRVLIFSMEMSKEELVLRMASALGGVASDPMRKGHMNDNDWQRLSMAKGAIDSLPLYIDDEPGLSISQLTSKAKMMHIKKPVGLIIVDYLQLMEGGKSENRTQEVSTISRGLKKLAKSLDCPVLALSQLNRTLESRSDKRPILSDLRESGAIEQDADVIQFIYRDIVYNEHSPAGNEAEIITAKQRNGPTGKDFILFQGEFSRFVSKSRVEI